MQTKWNYLIQLNKIFVIFFVVCFGLFVADIVVNLILMGSCFRLF